MSKELILALLPINCANSYKLECRDNTSTEAKCYSTICMLNQNQDNAKDIQTKGCTIYQKKDVQALINLQNNIKEFGENPTKSNHKIKNMSYKLKLEKIESVKELYDFRDTLNNTIQEESKLWRNEPTTNLENLNNVHEAIFYKERVEFQIKHFENKGLFLTSIIVDKNENQERFFTEKQISELQNEVYKITGQGEVMKLFNKLLGNDAS